MMLIVEISMSGLELISQDGKGGVQANKSGLIRLTAQVRVRYKYSFIFC